MGKESYLQSAEEEVQIGDTVEDLLLEKRELNELLVVSILVCLMLSWTETSRPSFSTPTSFFLLIRAGGGLHVINEGNYTSINLPGVYSDVTFFAHCQKDKALLRCKMLQLTWC